MVIFVLGVPKSYITQELDNMEIRRFVSAALFLFAVILAPKEANAQFEGGVKDSLRVLCVQYDNNTPGLEGVVAVSAIMECDSINMPTYMVGDSIVTFFSDIKAENIMGIQLLTGRALPKKLQKSFPNGLISLTLKDGEDLNSSQIYAEGDNLSRKAFVTKFSFADMDNGPAFAAKVSELVENYGTDDISFRNYKYFNPNRATPILAIDSLNRKAFLRSFNEFREEAIGEVIVYSAEEAQKIAGDMGQNGLVIVEIKQGFTLRDAFRSPWEKVQRVINEMYGVNFETMMMRNPVYADR